MAHNKSPVFVLEIPVRWSDQDKYGHVNNVAAFQYFEEIRGQWLSSIGFQMDGQGHGPVLIQQDATYLKEITYPATLTIEIFLYQPGNTSFRMFHRILDHARDILYVEGNVKCVWVDHEAKQSIPLPERLRTLAIEQGIAG